PGHSLAAHWKLPPGQSPPPGLTSPAFSEQANSTAFERQAGPQREHPGFQMSLMASGHHYCRDGLGNDRLYDLAIDPYEGKSLKESRSNNDPLMSSRKMLPDVLPDNPGSSEVEQAYLAPYRRWLEDVVHGSYAHPIAANN